MEAAAQLIADYVNQVVEKEKQEAARATLTKLGGEEALGKLQPRKNTLTRIRTHFQLLEEGKYTKLWQDFVGDHAVFGEYIDAEWLQIIADAHKELKPRLHAEAKVEEQHGRHPFATPKLQLDVPSWGSDQGSCGDWTERATLVLKELALPKAHWYTVLHQRITGSGQDDLADIRLSYPDEDIVFWLKKLTQMYDVNAESKLALRFKQLSKMTSFSELRIELQKVARRLNEYEGWDLSERVLVVWAGLAMDQTHWAILQREKPQSLADMQRLVYELCLDEASPDGGALSGSNNAGLAFSGANNSMAMAVNESPICKRFLEGICKFGNTCKFYHLSEICRDFNRGQCRRANCRFLHQSEQLQAPTPRAPVFNESQEQPSNKRGPCWHCNGPHFRDHCDEFKKWLLIKNKPQTKPVLSVAKAPTNDDYDKFFHMEPTIGRIY